eukprot:gene29510-2627_t
MYYLKGRQYHQQQRQQQPPPPQPAAVAVPHPQQLHGMSMIELLNEVSDGFQSKQEIIDTQPQPQHAQAAPGPLPAAPR